VFPVEDMRRVGERTPPAKAACGLAGPGFMIWAVAAHREKPVAPQPVEIGVLFWLVVWVIVFRRVVRNLRRN
jgi:hypothetical protein